MKRKNKSSNIMKEDLINEGNQWLFERVNQESVNPEIKFEDFVVFTNRYLYCIEKE